MQSCMLVVGPYRKNSYLTNPDPVTTAEFGLPGGLDIPEKLSAEI